MNWLDSWKSRWHDELKKKIEELHVYRNYLAINKRPAQEIQRIDRQVIRLEKKLYKGRKL